MEMKFKFKYLVVGACIMLSSTSCEKWLDVTASNQIKSDDLYESAAGYRDALIGVYINMTDPVSYGRDLTWNVVDLLSQQYSPLTNTATYYNLQIFDFQAQRAKNVIAPIWNNQYKTIVNINTALSKFEGQNALNQIESSIIKGELLGLRAFLHFDLIRLFGHGNFANRPELASKPTIPYVTSVSKDATPQRSYQETFTLLEKDLTDALELLKEDPIYPNAQRPANYYNEVNRNGFYSDRSFRMNYYAVKALQSRVLAWQGKLQAAATAAEEVIGSSAVRLFDGEAPTTANRTLVEENLFALDVEQLRDIMLPFRDIGNTAATSTLFITTASANEVFETSNTNIGLADFRYHTLQSSHSRGRLSEKYSGNDNRNTRLPLMKLPEMYYIAAEYYATSNPNKAINYLNEVRSSRNIQQELSLGLPTASILTEITKEYRKEYIAEGQLFYYFKRRGFETIPGLSAPMDDVKYILPYPDSEVEYGQRVQF
jgi:hypothetical protein